MSAILGLMTAEQISAFRPKNVRRSVFYMYPNGAAPLVGLLSMMKDEVTNDPEFKWYEKRMVEQRTTLAYISGTNPFYATVDSTFTTWTAAVADITMAQGTQYGIKVAASGTAQFRVGHLIKFLAIDVNAANVEVQGRITYVDSANNRLGFICTKAPSTDVDYDGASSGNEVLVIGAVQGEGAQSVSSSDALSTLEVYNTPIQPGNFCQIQTSNWQITGTAGKTSAWFDTRGVDPDMAKEASVNYSRYMEYTFIFGEKYERVVTAKNVERYTGGILYFLRLWEAGSTYGNTAATVDTDDTKRIIENSTGVLSAKTYNKYLERVFRFNRNKNNEVLCLCGNGFLQTLAEMYAGKQTFTAQMPSKDNFGMQVVGHMTSFGQVWYKTHKLFNLNSTLRFNGLFTDISCLKYRYLNGRDTVLRKDIGPKGADYVEDGWLSESGLEVDSPESHLYLKNVQDFSP
jgi:hypothetical protein